MQRRSRLARLLQASCLAQLAAAAAWFAWRWSPAPWQALAGSAAILLVGPIALAAEFAMLARVARAQDAPVPRARVGELAQAWWSETVHLYRTFYWRQPFRWEAQADHLPPQERRTGVVLVHGFMCNRGFWSAWLLALREQRRACIAVNLEPVYGSIDDYTPAVDDAVRRITAATGRAPLIVCHSMGGLAVRAWWQAEARRGAAAHLVTIGSPHAGTWLARWSGRTNGRQMRLGSAWLQELQDHERRKPLPPATCWYSNCDNVVFPATTATLPDAHNRFVAGQAHVALAFHPQVLRECLALLDWLDAQRQGESVTESATESL